MIDPSEFADRLASLPKEELRAIDRALGPEAGRILLKAIPELAPLIEPFLTGGRPVMDYGGMVRHRMDDGGLITNSNQRGDRVPIDAQTGEFIVSRPAVGAFGPQFFQGLNDAAQGRPGVSPTQPLGGLPGVTGLGGGAVTAGAVPGVPSTAVGASRGATPAVPSVVPGAAATPAIPSAPTLPAQAFARANANALRGGRPFQGAPSLGLPGQTQLPGIPDQARRNAAVQALKRGRPFV